MDAFKLLVCKVFILIGIAIGLIGVYFCIVLLKIKLKKADVFWIIEQQQKLVGCVCSVFIWGLFPISIGTIIWGILFYSLRFYAFKNNAKRLQELYQKWENHPKGYPCIMSIKQMRNVFFIPNIKTQARKEFYYSLNHHVDSFAILLMLYLGGIVSINSDSFALYMIEGLILATAAFVFIGKGLYFIEFYAPISPFRWNSILAFLPVAFVAVLYYLVIVIILNMCF